MKIRRRQILERSPQKDRDLKTAGIPPTLNWPALADRRMNNAIWAECEP